MQACCQILSGRREVWETGGTAVSGCCCTGPPAAFNGAGSSTLRHCLQMLSPHSYPELRHRQEQQARKRRHSSQGACMGVWQRAKALTCGAKARIRRRLSKTTLGSASLGLQGPGALITLAVHRGQSSPRYV